VRVYRVRYSCEGGNSAGFSWHASRREAEAAAAEARRNDPEEYRRHFPDVAEMPEVTEVEFKLTKRGVLRLLRLYAEHPDNG
jgi:hypothetical protein